MPFPATGVASFTTKVDFRDVIFAEHVNTLQSELRSTQFAIGSSILSSIYAEAPLVINTSLSTAFRWSNTTTWENLHDRISNIERGLLNREASASLGLPYYRKAGGALDDTTSAVSFITKSAVANDAVGVQFDQIQTKTSAGANGFRVDYLARPYYQTYYLLNQTHETAIYDYIDNLDFPVPEPVESGFNPFLLAGM